MFASKAAVGTTFYVKAQIYETIERRGPGVRLKKKMFTLNLLHYKIVETK